MMTTEVSRVGYTRSYVHQGQTVTYELLCYILVRAKRLYCLVISTCAAVVGVEGACLLGNWWHVGSRVGPLVGVAGNSLSLIHI